jgi:DNA primase
MNVDHNTLAVAVAKQLDGIKGNSEAQNFLLRQQQRERQEYSQQSLTVARPEVNFAEANRQAGCTTPETLERELTKYLLKYGHINCEVIEDRDVVTFNVARFIFEELDNDGLQFDIESYRLIADIYRAEWERLGDGVEVKTHIFINNPDIRVSTTAIELLTSDDNYVISKIWTQKEVHIESAEEQLSEGVPKAMMVYKWRTLDKRITELKARLASGTEEDESAVMATLAKYHAVRVKIARTAGRLI